MSSLFSLVLCAYLLELYFYTQSPSTNYVDRKWSRLETVLSLRDSGIDAQPSYSPQTLLTDFHTQHGFLPAGRISNVSTVVCNELGTPLIYKSDKYGFSNPPGTWEMDETDIMVVGDSNAQGWCVKPSQSYAGILRSKGLSVNNLGIAGNGPLLMLASLKEYIEKISPKVVFWFHYEGNDLDDLQIEKNNSLLQRYLLEPDYRQNILSKQEKIDSVLRDDVNNYIDNFEAIQLERQYRFTDFISLNNVQQFCARLRVTEQKMDLLRDIYLEANRTSKQHGSDFVLVYLPTSSTKRYRMRMDPYLERIRQFAQQNSIPFINILDQFEASGIADTIYGENLVNVNDAAHYSVEGYSLLSESLLQYINADK